MTDTKDLQPTFWNNIFLEEYNKPYFNNLITFINTQQAQHLVFPKNQDIYKAFEYTSLANLKVVIIGQDPYHGLNQAHGLSFSVNDGVKTPASLKNIFKELQTDLSLPIPQHGNLTKWAKQGVLLLNAVLTVNEGLPGSHQNKGWETFTDEVIRYISQNKTNCVFLLWGNYAKSKASLINTEHHLILEAAHPSPLARGAFFGNKHFSKANDYLISKKITPINWNLSDDNLFSTT